MQKFVKIGPSIGEILRLFNFSKWPLPLSWNFEFIKFYYLTRFIGPRRIIVPNFVKIGQSIVEI